MKFFKEETHSVLLVDIASSSVGVGLAGIRTGELPEQVVTVRVPFAHKSGFDFAHYETAMLFALREALEASFREGPRLLNRRGFPSAVNHAVISFSSPWYVSDLGSESAFRESLRANYPGTAMEIFEREDGLYSAAEKRLVQKIEDEIIRAYALKQGVAMQSFTFSFAKVISHAFKNVGPAMFVDVTGHTTDVLTSHQGFDRAMSLPMGHYRLKDLAGAWHAFWHQAKHEIPAELHKASVFVMTEGEFAAVKELLAETLPQAKIIPFYASAGFLREMATTPRGVDLEPRLAVLAAYSNLFL